MEKKLENKIYTKKELAQAYGISRTTLRRLFNRRFFDELKPLGYRVNDKFINLPVLVRFKELYGDI